MVDPQEVDENDPPFNIHESYNHGEIYVFSPDGNKIHPDKLLLFKPSLRGILFRS